MKKFLLILSLGLLLLPGCSDLNLAQQEATEAVLNVSNEAIRIKNNVATTAIQVKDAINSVNTALGAAQAAMDSVQEIGSEFENEPSLSSED